jgi:hypothetical protein
MNRGPNVDFSRPANSRTCRDGSRRRIIGRLQCVAGAAAREHDVTHPAIGPPG